MSIQVTRAIIVDDAVVPVVELASPAKGTQVCFASSYSDLACGKIDELDWTVSRTSP
jgi:hypothetical protein